MPRHGGSTRRLTKPQRIRRARLFARYGTEVPMRNQGEQTLAEQTRETRPSRYERTQMAGE